MAIKSVTWCTDTCLDCSEYLPTIAYICVPADLVLEPVDEFLGFVEASVTAFSIKRCPQTCKEYYTYTLEYDDSQLTPTYSLGSESINKVFCSNCLTALIKYLSD